MDRLQCLRVFSEVARCGSFVRDAVTLPRGAIRMGTPPSAALIYRLSGDANPLHVDPRQARLSSPVYPGETIRTEIWMEGDGAVFQATVPERGVVALSRGKARFGAGAAGGQART
ncbi:hypothetical protein GCM10023144_07350 [Pigmentiphaga soli]|uniref:MaoC-like domain-containing protein n=1 Tax=Pigmentiphaga soli TaxID=1007095 RepID=A0ABP8GJ26_9BURK